MNGFVIVFTLLFLIAGLSGCASWNAERNAPPVGVFIDVEGERIHVVDTGPRDSAKPPVIIIHGASVNLRDVKISLGDRLSQDRRVVMMDRPGRGYSTRPDDGWRLAVQARYIKAAADTLNVEDPIIVGQSLGGAVALAYALEYQEEMSGLVLLAAVSHEWSGGIAWYNSASQIPVLGHFLRRLVVPVYGAIAADGGVDESFHPDEPPINYYERSGLALLFRAKDFKSNAADIAHLKAQIIAQQDQYGSISLPVAIVSGADDTTVNPDIHSKKLATEIDGASLTLLPETGHALHHSETDAILAVIEGLGLDGVVAAN